jgi:hypothetical protein
MIDLTGVQNVPDVSTAIMKSLPALNSPSAVNAMGNARVRPASEETTALSHYVGPWQMEKTGLPDRASTATVRRAGRASTAMFAPQTRHAMR